MAEQDFRKVYSLQKLNSQQQQQLSNDSQTVRQHSFSHNENKKLDDQPHKIQGKQSKKRKFQEIYDTQNIPTQHHSHFPLITQIALSSNNIQQQQSNKQNTYSENNVQNLNNLQTESDMTMCDDNGYISTATSISAINESVIQQIPFTNKDQQIEEDVQILRQRIKRIKYNTNEFEFDQQKMPETLTINNNPLNPTSQIVSQTNLRTISPNANQQQIASNQNQNVSQNEQLHFCEFCGIYHD
eukprot:403337816